MMMSKKSAGFSQALVYLLFTQVILCSAAAYNDDIYIDPKHVMVNVGDEVKLSCKLPGELDTCIIKLSNGKGFSMKPGKSKDGITYFGSGLENGDCGIIINPVKEEYNGNITCNMYRDSADPTERQGTIQFVVARKPLIPELEVSVGGEPTQSGKPSMPNTYRERDQLTATCTVRDGRPAANISWFLDNEPLTEGLRMPLETCTSIKNGDLCTIQQNLTRTLQSSDDKKTLKCVANHFALKDVPLITEYHINVNYPPKPAEQPFEFFGLVEGAVGRVPILIEANPMPSVTWNIGGEKIYENSQNGRYTVESTVLKGPGMYESVLLIDTLTKEDTDQHYTVTASNNLGETLYEVSISTSPEPKVLELGAGLIIVIVVVILIILLTLGVVLYARAKGKLCFAVGSAEKRVVPPSEGAENPAVNHHASTEYIKNSSTELKKEKPKEDTPV